VAGKGGVELGESPFDITCPVLAGEPWGVPGVISHLRLTPGAPRAPRRRCYLTMNAWEILAPRRCYDFRTHRSR